MPAATKIERSGPGDPWYVGLPATTREQIDARIEQLLENPPQPHTAYDKATDQWTTTYGAGPD